MDLGNVTKYFYGHHGTVEACSSVYRPNIKINKLHDDVHLPTYGSKNAACADLYAYIGFDDATMVNKNSLYKIVGKLNSFIEWIVDVFDDI